MLSFPVLGFPMVVAYNGWWLGVVLLVLAAVASSVCCTCAVAAAEYLDNRGEDAVGLDSAVEAAFLRKNDGMAARTPPVCAQRGAKAVGAAVKFARSFSFQLSTAA